MTDGLLLALHPVLVAYDVPASLAFFARLGFAERFRDDPEAPRYAAVRRGAIEFHLQWGAPADQAGGDRPVYRFHVTDVDRLFDHWVAADAIAPDRMTGPYRRPADTPWGTREFHLHDPAGNGLQFYAVR